MPDDGEVRDRTLQIVQSYQTLLREQRFDDWIELWAEDGTCEFPFAPEGRPSVYIGKRDILAYMAATPGKIAIEAIEHMQIHPALDPNVAIVEIAVKGRVLVTSRPYNQRYIVVFEVKGGKLWRYREYWNPLISIESFGGYEAWLSAFGTQKSRDV